MRTSTGRRSDQYW